MKLTVPNLVKQAQIVSKELIRVAILWNEIWYQAFEDTSRMYFRHGKINEMLRILGPLHKRLKKENKTRNEKIFLKKFGQHLKVSWTLCKKFIKTGNKNNLEKAWKSYVIVFKALTDELPRIKSLKLHEVSNLLENVENLELVIPGTYKPGQKIIKIVKFHPNLDVISSKQRPRKLKILGNDARTYQFLLKGHEDLRQDERVMQLFNLVNTLLSNNPETSKRNLSIQRYAVVPLSPNSGLIGWVPLSDTLHDLIIEYRKARKIIPNIESVNLQHLAPDYEKLQPLQKLDTFNQVLSQISGKDLAQILWLKSSNSESWLDRRTNYTRSLAVMSMVGYILGLGDRHPSNLMLNRLTGKIIHIDFGDCFEVAMHRQRFPEKIPFRLTRMLINAMEISGIDGNFRYTSRNVMKVLRENKESLMTILEAFIFDPLVNWKLGIDDNLNINNNNNNNNNNRNNHNNQDLGNTENKDHINNHFNLINQDSSLLTKVDNKSILNLDIFYQSISQKALNVIKRISNKLTGNDFSKNHKLDVQNQVDKIIQQATSHENLSQCYLGWCPYW